MLAEFNVTDYDNSWDGGEALCHDLKQALLDEKQVVVCFEGQTGNISFILASIGQIYADLGPKTTSRTLSFVPTSLEHFYVILEVGKLRFTRKTVSLK